MGSLGPPLPFEVLQALGLAGLPAHDPLAQTAPILPRSNLPGHAAREILLQQAYQRVAEEQASLNRETEAFTRMMEALAGGPNDHHQPQQLLFPREAYAPLAQGLIEASYQREMFGSTPPMPEPSEVLNPFCLKAGEYQAPLPPTSSNDDAAMRALKEAIAAMNSKRANMAQQARSSNPRDPPTMRETKAAPSADGDAAARSAYFSDPAAYRDLKAAYDFCVHKSEGLSDLLRRPSLSAPETYQGCLEVGEDAGIGLRLPVPEPDPVPTFEMPQRPRAEEQDFFRNTGREEHWQKGWSNTGPNHSWGSSADRWSYDQYGRYRYWDSEAYAYKEGYAYKDAGTWGGSVPAPATTNSSSWNPGCKPQCQFFIAIEEEPKFRVTRKILGQHGSNVKRIAQATNAKLRLRGRGSGFLEGKDNLESTDDLMLCISAPDEGSYQEAIRMVTELLEDVYDKYKLFCLHTSKPMPHLEIQMHAGPRPGSR